MVKGSSEMYSNICCNSFMEAKEKCGECPSGSYCSKDCPEFYQGIRYSCCHKCNCSYEETCDKMKGCVPDPQYIKLNSEKCLKKERYVEKRSKRCCPNYRQVGKECKECWPGTYDENCKRDCPSTTYGHFCLSKCDCTSLCSPTHGCNLSRKEIFFEKESQWKWGLTFSGVFAILIVLVIVGVCVYRKRKGGFWIKGTEKVVSIDGLTEGNEENDSHSIQSFRYKMQENNIDYKDSEPSRQKVMKVDPESIAQDSYIKLNNTKWPVQTMTFNVDVTSELTLDRNTYLEPKNIMFDKVNKMDSEDKESEESNEVLHSLENLHEHQSATASYLADTDSNTYLT